MQPFTSTFPPFTSSLPSFHGLHTTTLPPFDLPTMSDNLFAPPPLDPHPICLYDNNPSMQQFTPPPPPPPMDPLNFSVPIENEEDSAIRLVHLLVNCADAIQRGESSQAGNMLDEMSLLLSQVNTTFGIGKVATHFVDALLRRLYLPPQQTDVEFTSSSVTENETLYHHFYEAAPYLKFAHFTANQAILEAFHGQDRVHVIDFNLMQGLQWPALIQALALRPGGPPILRITGIGPPSPNGRDHLREIGLRLAELARSVNVRFAFRGVAAARLEDVRPWMLQVVPGEAVAFNSVFQLHKLLQDPQVIDHSRPIDQILGMIRGIKPKIVTVVEQEADHNAPAFIDRFTEALFYYSAMFDSLGERQQGTPDGLAEVYLQREIRNIVCHEGAARVERHEPLSKWQARLESAGLRPVHLGSNALKQACMLLTLFSGEGYSVEEDDGCLTLGWHSRPLISTSAWCAADRSSADEHNAVDVEVGNEYNNNNNRLV